MWRDRSIWIIHEGGDSQESDQSCRVIWTRVKSLKSSTIPSWKSAPLKYKLCNWSVGIISVRKYITIYIIEYTFNWSKDHAFSSRHGLRNLEQFHHRGIHKIPTGTIILNGEKLTAFPQRSGTQQDVHSHRCCWT